MGVFVAGLLSADTAELSLDLAVLPWSFNYQWKHSQHKEAGLESVLITWWQWTHLFPLHHLLVEVVGESTLRVELSGPLGAHEHAVLTHQTPPADGDQRDAVATHPFVQVEVSALHLSAHRDCPTHTHTHTESDGCVSLCFGLSPVIKAIPVYLQLCTLLHLDPRPPRQRQPRGWCGLCAGTGCRSLQRWSSSPPQNDSHPFSL